MKVVLDLDGVLVDFVRGACDAHDRDTPEDDEWNPEDRYNLSGIFGMSRDDFWNPITRDVWANMKWTHDGRQILNLLEEKFGSENIVICTSPTGNPDSVAGKIDWIIREIPQYSRRYFVGPEKHFLAGPRTLMVDDSDHNVNDFRNHGGNAILVPRLWNDNHVFHNFTVQYIKDRIR